MFLELLVAGICVSGKSGCSSAASAYYTQSVELQDLSSRVDTYSRKIATTNEWLMYSAVPIYTLGTKEPIKFLLYKGTTLDLNLKKSAIFVEWSY